MKYVISWQVHDQCIYLFDQIIKHMPQKRTYTAQLCTLILTLLIKNVPFLFSNYFWCMQPLVNREYPYSCGYWLWKWLLYFLLLNFAFGKLWALNNNNANFDASPFTNGWMEDCAKIMSSQLWVPWVLFPLRADIFHVSPSIPQQTYD